MSKSTGQFGFSHLEEDDDEAQYQSGSLDLQPHLGNNSSETVSPAQVSINTSPEATSVSHSGAKNPTPTQDNNNKTDLAVSFERLSYSTDPQPEGTVPAIPPPPPPQSVENKLTIVPGKTTTNPVEEASASSSTDTQLKATENGSSRSEAQQHSVDSQGENSECRVNVGQGCVVTRPDGSRYIDTRGAPPQTWHEEGRKKPLRKERMRLLKIFSIIACVFFLPTGIAAAIYAFKTEKEFHEGILRGNIDRAQKFAKRSERFIILSFIMALIVGCLVVAIIETPYYEKDHHNRHYGG